MSGNRKAMQGFLGSLLLLVVALTAFFWMLNDGDDVGGVQPRLEDVDTILAESKRGALRLSSRGAVGESAAGRESAAVPSGKPAPLVAGRLPVPAQDTLQLPPDGGAEFENDPFDPEVQRAINLIDGGKVDEALAVLEDILKKDPKHEQALVELAMIQLLDLKQPEQAVGYLQRAMEVNPKNQVVMSELVSLYEEQGRMDEGLAFMTDVYNKNPENADLAYGIGQMLSLQGRDQDAVNYLERATQSPDNQVRAFRDLAESYSRMGDAEKSVDAYSRAIEQQEREVTEKQARGLPTTFAEERLNYTRMDKVRELVRKGDIEQAQALLDEVSQAMPGDESIAALQETINKRKL